MAQWGQQLSIGSASLRSARSAHWLLEVKVEANFLDNVEKVETRRNAHGTQQLKQKQRDTTGRNSSEARNVIKNHMI